MAGYLGNSRSGAREREGLALRMAQMEPYGVENMPGDESLEQGQWRLGRPQGTRHPPLPQQRWGLIGSLMIPLAVVATFVPRIRPAGTGLLVRLQFWSFLKPSLSVLRASQLHQFPAPASSVKKNKCPASFRPQTMLDYWEQ